MPLIVASAIVPIQIVIVILLLRSRDGRTKAVAWVAGLTAVRLAQGVVFGLVLSEADDDGDAGAGRPGLIVSTILLVVGVMLLVTAVRALVGEEDPDAPPPRWLTAMESLTPVRAFLFGAGSLVLGVKFWVFTLGALSAIEDAALDRSTSIAVYLVFVVLAVSIQIVLIAVAFLLPQRSEAVLDRVGDFLTHYNRWILVGLGAVFGTWFVVKALDGYGIL